MSAVSKARALVAGTIAAGAAVLAAAPWMAAEAQLGTLALLGAAVVLMELMQVPSDDGSPDTGDAGPLSFSSAVHVAAILVIGPWTAALVAAFGVLAVDRLRGAPWRQIGFNGSVFALAALTGGFAFRLAGGESGLLGLPGDFPALAALVLTYYAVNNGLTGAIVAFDSGRRAFPVLREVSRDGLSAAAGEASLGVALAFFALTEPWAIAVLAPLVLAVYRSYERLVTLRRETAHALETFANVVDERDPSTFRHSARVAEHVRRLAEALGLPAPTVARLRWAGRLHDLGKVAVDASVLRKPGRLDASEWESVLRHPRLSARLLRRFRLAADEARAVEYHHERFDGRGYYGIEAAEIPLVAHFLIVADSFDAMTSDRSYRRGLPAEEALAEIEANAGSQFHPIVAKAFVALERGEDPLGVLTAEERAELRRLQRTSLSVRMPRIESEVVAAGSLVGGLVALGLGAPYVSAPLFAVALAALVVNRLDHRHARRLAQSLRRALARASTREQALASVVGELGRHCTVRWAGLLPWDDGPGNEGVALPWDPHGEAPGLTAITSWLLREAEADGCALVGPGFELGRDYDHVAVPLQRGGGVSGYLLVGLAGRTRRVAEALEACALDLAPVLVPPPGPSRRLEAVAS